MHKHSPEHILEIYGNAWSAHDEPTRRRLFEQSLDPTCVYTDPLTQTTGYEALAQYMAQLNHDVPGVKFVTTALLSHHQRSLSHWNMLDGAGAVIGQGASYFLFAEDGRLIQMNGFFEQP